MTTNSSDSYRICFLMEDFYPYIHGASRQTIMLSEIFIRSGSRVAVITRQIEKTDPKRENYKGIEIVRVKPAVGIHRLGKYLMLLPSFWAMFKNRNHFDIVIVPDLKVLGVIGIAVAKLFNKKCILNQVSCGEMDGGFAVQYDPSASRIKRRIVTALVNIRNRLLMKADKFVSISSAISDEFERSGVPADIVQLIYYGIDTNVYRPIGVVPRNGLRQQLGLPAKRHFIFTGRLIYGKGVEYLIKVWRRLASEHDDIHLILVGSGEGHKLSAEEEIKTFVVENGLESTVTFTGSITNVDEYLQVSDYFVFPSESEGLGLSLIEGMSCGLACIGSSVGGILDIIDDGRNGKLVTYGVEQELYDAMKALIESGDLSSRFREEGRKTVAKKFDIEINAQRYLDLFDDLLRDTRAAA